jgi:HK97 family phage major capsid protein
MAVVDQADLELVRELRAEWRKSFEEGMQQERKKGFVDDEARSKCTRIDERLIKVTDEVIATQAKRIDEQAKRIDDQDAKLRAFGERLTRPPGAGADDGLHLVKSLGQRFIEADNFKNAQFQGKFQIQVGLTKTRIKDLSHKATIAEGGATTITPPAGAYPIFPRRIGLVPQQFAPLTMRDLVDVIPLDATNAVEYVTEVWTNNAGYQVLEGDLKPSSAVTYTDHTAVVRTIAHYVKVSRQMAADVSFIITTINNRLSQFVLLKEDTEILYGDNSAGHLWGIMPQATAATVYYPTAGQPANDTAIDQLNMAETYVENQFYFPTAYILHPTTWARIEAFKTTYGQYLMPGVPYSEGTQRLWGLPVITTPVMAVNDYLCGAFPGNCALFDRESVNVEMAFQNEDDFIRNLITIRAEERVAFAVYVPKAFAKGPLVTALPVGTVVEPEGNGGRGVKK